MTEKICSACGETKPATEFYRDSQRSDGLSIHCKPCKRAKLTEYQKREPRHQAAPGMKRCSMCKQDHPIADFHRNKNFHDGLDRTCKRCAYARFKGWSAKNREQLAAGQRARYAKDPSRYADYELTSRLGLPRGTYDKMLAAQGGKCAICKTDTPGERTRRFAVDHCHDTDVIRGLLCGNCNRGIGYLQHSEDILLAAAVYLKDYPQVDGGLTKRSRVRGG